jgi:uncharacterized membrane protein YadS
MAPMLKDRFDKYFGGVALAVVIAAAASFLSDHYGAPAMLFALLIGMAFHFLSENPNRSHGIEFSAKTLLGSFRETPVEWGRAVT